MLRVHTNDPVALFLGYVVDSITANNIPSFNFVYVLFAR